MGSCNKHLHEYLPAVLAKSDVNFQIKHGENALSRYVSNTERLDMQIVKTLVEAGKQNSLNILKLKGSDISLIKIVKDISIVYSNFSVFAYLKSKGLQVSLGEGSISTLATMCANSKISPSELEKYLESEY